MSYEHLVCARKEARFLVNNGLVELKVEQREAAFMTLINGVKQAVRERTAARPMKTWG